MLNEISSTHPIIFTIAWQTSLFIAAGITASHFCKRHPARAHQVLFLSMIAAIAVPFITIAVKHMGLGIFIAKTEPVVESIAANEGSIRSYDGLLSDSIQMAALESEEHFIQPVALESEKSELHLIDVLLVGWAAASVIFLARLILTFFMGIQLVKKAQPFDCPVFAKSIKAASLKLGIKETVTVYNSKSVSSPVIWCWKQSPILLFPSGKRILTEKMDLVGILCHELAHLKRRDHVAGLLSELMVVFLPWHPLLWLAKKRLSSLSEHACDDWVMAAGGCRTNYAESLLDLVPVKQMAFVPSVVRNKNVLKGRVMRILKGRYGNPHLSKKRILSAVLITSCVSLMVACAQTRSSSPEQYPAREAPHEMAANNNPGFKAAGIEAGTPNEPAYRKDKTAESDQTTSTPHPGTEAALRRHIEGIVKKQPVTEEMAPGLVAAVEQQWPQLQSAFESYGALKSITFKGKEYDNDVYHVEFEHAATAWTIGPLIDGKVSTLFFGPAVNRGDNEPSPGLREAIRRELEGSLAGEPAYEIMSPALQAATREQWLMISADAERLGAVKAITFQNVNSRGWDVYHVTFANGAATVMAEPLTDGKLNGLLHTDITVNHDGNAPSPGLSDGIRRESEGNFAETPAYRDVSIQLASAEPGERGSIMFNPATGGLQIRKQTLRFVIAEAYGVNETQVVGRDWDNEPRYNITAVGLKASASTRGSEFAAPSVMYGAALRELLETEFGLVTSSEQGELDGYALLVGDGKPKLAVSDANEKNHLFSMSPEGLRVTSLPLSEVAKFLTNLLGGLVVDQTGLQENYDFEVKLPMPASPDTSPDPAAVTEALEQQLGLKVEAKKLNVDILNIVDLKPSAEVVTTPSSASVQMPAPPPALEELREIPHHFRFQLRPEPTEKVDTPPMLAGSGPPPPPQYPLAAARNNIEGRVVMRFVVDADGEVKYPEVVEAEPEGVFEESMIANIEEFEFEPAILNGKPVACMMKYTIGFELD